MRSPLGQLLHDLLDIASDHTERLAAWPDADRKLAEAEADRVVELELDGLGSLAARIEARVDRAREAIRFESSRVSSGLSAGDMTLECLRDASVLVDATDRRLATTVPGARTRAVSRDRAPVSEAPSTNVASGGIGEGDPELEVPPLTDNEVAIINTLARFDPMQLASAAKIEAEMEPANRRSQRSIGKAVNRLIELGLAERPMGDRSGVRLTLAGRRVARKVAD